MIDSNSRRREILTYVAAHESELGFVNIGQLAQSSGLEPADVVVEVERLIEAGFIAGQLQKLMTGGDPRPWFLTQPRLTISGTTWLEGFERGTPPKTGKEGMASIDSASDPRRVVVVHGRDEFARDALFDFLRALDLRPLTWEEMVSQTTLGTPDIQRILSDAFQDAQAVVVLFTPDDLAFLRADLVRPDDHEYERIPTGQPRQNVLFEGGLALAWKPARTIVVEHGPRRPFSDFLGRHLVRIDPQNRWRTALATRLETAGCPVNRSGDWLRTRDFPSFPDDVTQTGISTAPSRDELERRRLILQKLRVEYCASHEVSPAMIAGTEPMPKQWVEERLSELGERWRQDAYL